MLKLILDVFTAFVLYLLPGYIILSWADFRNLRGINRLVIALAISMVTVPYLFILVANLVPFQPGLLPWLILVVLLITVSIIIRRTGRLKPVTLMTKDGFTSEPKKIEKVSIFLLIILVAALTNLPRILMFIKGGQALDLGPVSDESWHIDQLISVARTGIPPEHYFFPSIRLGYYYASWIIPAILGNLPGIFGVSLLRAMAIHVFIQVFTFLGLLYLLFQQNFKSIWLRLIGMSFVTIMGGFALIAKLPGIDFIDWWQRSAGWLSRAIQISQFPTLYEYVPQHLAGGMVLLLLLLLYKHLDIPMILKIACSGVLMAFCFMTSPFIFAAIGLAIGIVLLSEWRWLWSNRAKSLFWLLIVAGTFLITTWYSVSVFTSTRGKLTWNNYYVTVIESLRGNSALAPVDKAITLLGLPLVGGTILIISMGLPFLLYVLWWGKRILTGKRLFNTLDDVVIGIFPLLCLLLVFLFRDEGGGDNFAMRGFIPAQIFIVIAAVQVLDELGPFIERIGWKRWILVYIYGCFLIGQSFSTIAEVRSVSEKIVKLALWRECGWGSLLGIQTQSYDTYCLPAGPSRYVYWVNQHTPTNALVLEMGPISGDTPTFRWLERNRFMVPESASAMGLFSYDLDFILPGEWDKLTKEGPKSSNVLDWYKAISFRNKGSQPVYLVTRLDGQAPSQAGNPVYQDKYVKVFYLSPSILDK